MEDLLFQEEIETNILITEESVSCEYGKLNFSFDENTAIINAISVYSKRRGVGTRLVNTFEMLVQEKKLTSIEVPAFPTKEAVSFWKSLGYRPSFEEDRYWAKRIIRSAKDNSWDIPQGVVVMNKNC